MGRGTGSPSNTVWPGLKPTSVSSCILIPSSRLATIYMDRGLADYTDAGKACAHQFRMWAAAVPLSVGEAGSPSNTVWPGPRPTCMSSFILIRPTVWPQYTNVRDRTDRTDNDLTAYTHATDCPTWTTKVISKDDLRIVVHYRSLLYAIHCYLFTRNVNLYECVLFMSQKLLTGQQICPQNDRINAK